MVHCPDGIFTTSLGRFFQGNLQTINKICVLGSCYHFIIFEIINQDYSFRISYWSRQNGFGLLLARFTSLYLSVALTLVSMNPSIFHPSHESIQNIFRLRLNISKHCTDMFFRMGFWSTVNNRGADNSIAMSWDAYSPSHPTKLNMTIIHLNTMDFFQPTSTGRPERASSLMQLRPRLNPLILNAEAQLHELWLNLDGLAQFKIKMLYHFTWCGCSPFVLRNTKVVSLNGCLTSITQPMELQSFRRSCHGWCFPTMNILNGFWHYILQICRNPQTSLVNNRKRMTGLSPVNVPLHHFIF